MTKKIHPSLKKEAFNCPRCGVLCPHKHYEVKRSKAGYNYDINLMEIETNQKKVVGGPRFVDPINN